MKYLLLIGLIMAGLVLAQFAQGQTIDEVIAKYANARGGLDKLLGIKSIYMEGAREMMGTEIMVKVTKEQGKLSRTDLEMDAGNGFLLITDKEGWNMFSMRSPTPAKMTDDAVANQQTELDIAGPLINYSAKGHKAELIGKELLEDISCYKIKLTTSAGNDILYWIDAETYLLIQSSVKVKGSFFGHRGDKTVNVSTPSEADMLTLYSDYKAVGGILFPHTIISKMPGAPQGNGTNTTTFDKMELNVSVDAKLYKPE